MMKRRYFLGYSLFFAAGCASTTIDFRGSQPSDLSHSASTPLPAKLRFAVTDTKGLAELQQDYDRFRTVLEAALNVPIEFFPVEDYFTAAVALQSDQVDLVWADPSVYVAIRARTNAVPIVTITRPDYRTIIVVRADSGIQTLADLTGKTIDMLELGSTASHIGGIKMLIDAGLNPQTDFKVILPGTHSLKTLKDGEAQAWARPLHRYKIVLQSEGESEQDYPIIAQGQLLPGDVLVLSSQLSSAVMKEIQSRILQNQTALLQAIDSTENLASRFRGATLIPANDADYDMVREAYRAIGQDTFLQPGT